MGEQIMKLNLEPGRKYRGSAWINEYGQFEFMPERKGSRPGNYRLVHDNGAVTIHESSHFFKLSIKVGKKMPSTLIPALIISGMGKVLEYFKPPIR